MILACVASYLLGAIPFGFVIARARGVDIRTVGSGNIGATNVWRFIGKKWGALVYLLDMAKGYASAALIPTLAAGIAGIETSAQLGLACGLLSVAGHNWPIYLKFKGGKGIATTAGVLLGVAPAAMGLGIAAWLVVFLASRYVSLASILAALTVAASGWFLYDARLLCGVLTVLGGFAVWRHRGNIQRLVSGSEHRFDLWKKKPQSPTNTQP
jgi:glycerol-3-phosphate acyltransferase PlsY